MILPTKHVKFKNCILSLGSTLLENINERQTVTRLWDEVKSFPETMTFERFTLGLDLLFILGLIDFKEGIIVKVKK